MIVIRPVAGALIAEYVADARPVEPVAAPAPVVPAPVDLGVCEDCGSELSNCCGQADCGRIFCEACEFGPRPAAPVAAPALVAPVAAPAPVAPVVLVPAPVDLGVCEDCGSELSNCCGQADCGRIFCEACEAADRS